MIRCLFHLHPATTEDEADGDDVGDYDPLNAKEHINGWTPLHLAAVGEFLDVVYLLMEAGCDPSVKDNVSANNFPLI